MKYFKYKNHLIIAAMVHFVDSLWKFSEDSIGKLEKTWVCMYLILIDIK